LIFRFLHDWTDNRLSDDQKAITVNLSRDRLPILEARQAGGWNDIVSLNESWFYFSTDHEGIWLESEEL
jgi:hypothetical protein